MGMHIITTITMKNDYRTERRYGVDLGKIIITISYTRICYLLIGKGDKKKTESFINNSLYLLEY